MIERLAKSIVEVLNTRGAIDEDKLDVYVYGADLAIYTLISTVGVLLAGTLLQRFWETVLILSIYYTNQTIGGGFHATTHLRCFLTMLIGLIPSLLTYWLPIVPWIEYSIVILSFFILMVIPLVLHSNKRHLESNRAAFIKRSRTIVVLQSLVVMALMGFNINVYTHACCLGLVVSAISRLGGFYSSARSE